MLKGGTVPFHLAKVYWEIAFPKSDSSTREPGIAPYRWQGQAEPFSQVSGTSPLCLAMYFHSGWNKIPVGLFFVVYSCDCDLHQRCIPLASTPSGPSKSFPQSRLLRLSTSFLVPSLCTLLSLLLHTLHTSFSSDRLLPSYFRGCPGLEPFLSNSVILINYQDPETAGLASTVNPCYPIFLLLIFLLQPLKTPAHDLVFDILSNLSNCFNLAESSRTRLDTLCLW